MDIIFLDIDGVLRTTKSDIWWSTKLSQPIPDNLFERRFDPNSVSLINQITNLTRAKIVIISNWRNNFKFEELKLHLVKRGITGNIIGKTPILETRGIEIQYWLDTNSVNNYVVVDDNINDIVNHINPNKIVKCESKDGFTQKEFDKVIEILA
jgi:hypothetical protein